MSCENIDNNFEFENTDLTNVPKKITKYFILAIVVGITAKWISSQKLSLQEIAIISLSATSCFILLDLYSPSIVVDLSKKNLL